MRTVFLTSGPRGSGKSTYIETARVCYPEITIISRDEILLSLFGKTALDPYVGGHQYVFEVLFQRVEECLAPDLPRQLVILDCWNGFSYEREAIIKKLRMSGADRVFCLYFITPLNTCLKWFRQKPDAQGYSEISIKGDHKLYHTQAKTIQENGFDGVFRVNPLETLLIDFPFVYV